MSQQINFAHLNEFKDDDFVDGIHEGTLKMPKEGWNLILQIIWKVVMALLNHRGKLRTQVDNLEKRVNQLEAKN